MDFALMVNRMIRASRLESSLYEEVEDDVTLTNEAFVVVAVVALLSGIGTGMAAQGGFSVLALSVGILSAIVGYVVWAAVTLVVGRGVFQATADMGELLRTLGYASSPRALLVLAFIPVIGPLLSLIVWFWTIATGIVAIRQALDVTTGQAVATAIVGVVVVAIVGLLIAIPFGIAGLGMAMMSGS